MQHSVSPSKSPVVVPPTSVWTLGGGGYLALDAPAVEFKHFETHFHTLSPVRNIIFTLFTAQLVSMFLLFTAHTSDTSTALHLPSAPSLQLASVLTRQRTLSLPSWLQHQLTAPPPSVAHIQIMPTFRCETLNNSFTLIFF